MEAHENKNLIPCIACNRCREVCATEIGISESFAAWNLYVQTGDLEAAREQIIQAIASHKRRRADRCIYCGACETVCPRGISIRTELEKVAEVLG